ncbi:DUF2252 domain-containing protein [Taibaiella soli]|uniref:DUF2252 domain-containing protein n=1 Tax=Taibaiella soli TaxID=1649169 RepID=A0A2W2BTZ2_9BACT|nr:DUF2252 family protein [Taibaiella soli]PZF71283.1 DUF2252 domain-containing protein [Taibaiella soli]
MDSIMERIIAFNKNRLPKMVELKYCLMEQNLFRFYRGTCHLFYQDLALHPEFFKSPKVWISGDLHLENLGSFTGDNEQVYFDLNDFDEAVLAPVYWELLRALTSIYVGFTSLGIEDEKADNMARLFLKSYKETLRKCKPDYVEASTAKGIICEFLGKVSCRKQKNILIKRAILKRKKVQMLVDNPKHFKIKKAFKKQLMEHITDWLKMDERSPYNYEVIDVVFRLAGTGSVGLERYAFLLKSSNAVGHKYILLDMKEAAPSSLEPYIQIEQPVWESEAERVITIQRKMQNRCPALLSVTIFKGKSFIMQEMQPTKDNLNFGLLQRYKDMVSVIDTMGMLTASTQLRSSGQSGSAIADELKAFASEEVWEEELVKYAKQYLEEIKRHFSDFLRERSAKHALTRFGKLSPNISMLGPLKGDIGQIEKHMQTVLKNNKNAAEQK